MSAAPVVRRAGTDDVCEVRAGTAPLVVSIPHAGTRVPAEIAAGFTPEGEALPDTDLDVDRLYDFLDDLGASWLRANCSRYVVDLNRPPDDASLYPGRFASGLCPVETFAGRPIYRDGAAPDPEERHSRLERYWRPYHERLAALLDAGLRRHGRVLLWDAHSIASRVPRLFEGELPLLNLGTDNGRSAAPGLAAAIAAVARESGRSWVVDGRFRGGYITRHYGSPAHGVHAMQLELAQRGYVDERAGGGFDEARAARLRPVLRAMIERGMRWLS